MRVNQVAKLLGSAVELFQMQKGPHHRILERIFGILPIFGYAIDGVKDTFGVTRTQLNERPLLTALRRAELEADPHPWCRTLGGKHGCYKQRCRNSSKHLDWRIEENDQCLTKVAEGQQR